MNQKRFILVFVIIGLFAVASLTNAQAPTVGPSSGGGGQAPSIVCYSDNDCGEGLICRNGECEKPVNSDLKCNF